MKIQKLSTSIKSTEAATVLQSVGKAGEKENFENDIYISDLLVTTKGYEVKLTDAINQIGAISKLENKDTTRDNGLRAVFYLHKGYMFYHMPRILKAAQVLEPILDRYGFGIVDESYATESAHVESLLADLNSDEAKAAIDQLPGMSNSIAQVTQAQKEFVNEYVAYKEAKAQQEDFESATELKKQTLNLINGQLVVYLRAMQIANPEVYGRFAETVAQIISDTNSTIKRRSKSAEEVE